MLRTQSQRKAPLHDESPKFYAPRQVSLTRNFISQIDDICLSRPGQSVAGALALSTTFAATRSPFLTPKASACYQALASCSSMASSALATPNAQLAMPRGLRELMLAVVVGVSLGFSTSLVTSSPQGWRLAADCFVPDMLCAVLPQVMWAMASRQPASNDGQLRAKKIVYAKYSISLSLALAYLGLRLEKKAAGDHDFIWARSGSSSQTSFSLTHPLLSEILETATEVTCPLILIFLFVPLLKRASSARARQAHRDIFLAKAVVGAAYGAVLLSIASVAYRAIQTGQNLKKIEDKAFVTTPQDIGAT